MGQRKRPEEREKEDDRCDTEPQSDSYLTLELVTYRLLYGHSICSHSLFLFVPVRQIHKSRQSERGTRIVGTLSLSFLSKSFLFAYKVRELTSRPEVTLIACSVNAHASQA